MTNKRLKMLGERIEQSIQKLIGRTTAAKPRPRRSETIGIVKTRYYVGYWFLQGKGGDLKGRLFRERDGGHFYFKFRYRYYADNQAVGALDVRSPYSIRLSRDEDKAINAVERMIEQIVSLGYLAEDNYVERFWVRGDGDVLTAKAKAKNIGWVVRGLPA